MIPAKFEYFSPATLPEALSLLRTYGEEAKVLSGGQSLIPLLKLRLASPAYLIDINCIPATVIRLPIPPARSGGAYVKLERKVGDFAIAGVAAHVTLDATGACARAGIGLTNVGPVPLKAHQAEEFLRGKRLDLDTIKQAALL